ncbi:MAG: PAS domain S-box protein [Anaerolineae bacterium]|jgi:PAS domain S-box-containing protein|nr:PAS domain S-box protein [Anaerolineae bacterium]MBT7072634.1 PAS domain S-box protein [Anaerolineae bacterium]MBT7325191.1 PAS domain S-box protein [Anaerolineae bacterium]
MNEVKKRFIILIPVGIALLSFLTGGGIATHLISRENDSSALLVIYFSAIALFLTSLSVAFFWIFIERVRKNIEKSLNISKAAEHELLQTEQEYRQIFDGINDAVFVETLKGEVLDVNARACQIFGWSREEFLTKTTKDMVPPEYHALLPEEQDESTVSEEPFETVNVRANGEYFPVSVSGRIQTINKEKRLLVVVRDITEQKNVENELKKQHQFLSNVIESLTQPFYVINVDDYSIEISNSAARGGKPIGATATCYTMTHDRDTPCGGDEHPCPLREVVKSRGLVQYEHIHYDKDGNPRDFEVHGYPIFDSHGNVKQMIEYSLDITERKKAEENLLKFSRAITHSPTSVVITEANAKISYVNPAYLEGTGYTEDEVLGKYATFLYSDLHPKEFYKDIWKKVSAGNVWRGEISSRNSRDEIIWEAVSIAPVVDVGGKIINFVGVMEDITENKQILVEMEKAKEAAEAAAQAKADFLANMSHEIRTPLNAIYGMTSLMLDTPLNAEQQDFIETIRGGSDTLLKVINDILDFSKIEAGKIDLETQPFYVRSCMEDALDLLAEKAAGKMLDLAYLIEDDVPPVVIGDVTRLRQILVNLLNNAIKFTDKGEVVISMKSCLVENGQYELHFSVRDTGIGIPANKIDKLFKSFSQVDTSTTRKYGGTGLGLAISNQLAQNMGGTMWVESEEGKGSTFHFTILADAELNAKPLYSTDDVPQLSDKRVLIVDDNATNRLILVKQTESWGMKPRAIASGPDALELLASGEEFDIAILDMQMPEMDGFTLAQEISAEKKLATLPLIILTSIKREKARASDANVTAFLNKPIKTSNLFNVLMSIIDSTPMPEKELKKHTAIDSKMAERHPLRILLAEDNMINQKVALKLLSRLGYRADVAANGVEVIEALDRQTYDLVFMDIQMPEMDGDEATSQVRARWPQDRQPFIVAMTAHALEGDREKYLERGMDDYISKPINVNVLIKALEKANPIEDKST